MQPTNIDQVLVKLDLLIAQLRAEGSRLAYFAAMYRAVTRRVRAGISEGRFSDGERMDRFDTIFANYYFAALEAERLGRRPPRAWKVAFDAAQRPGPMILQHLLLGMNAHINLDLPSASADVAPGAALPELKEDFLAINGILAELLDPVQALVGELSPLLNVLDHLGGRTDEAIMTFSIVHARDEAWHEATRLSTESTPQRARSMLSLDRRVTLLAERILLPGPPFGLAIDLIARTENDSVRAVTDRLLCL